MRSLFRAYPRCRRRRCIFVRDYWLGDLESLEAISQDDDARRIFLRMAAMSQTGSLPNFIAELQHDQDLDDQTKGHLTEIAHDSGFLLAVEEYVRSTHLLH